MDGTVFFQLQERQIKFMKIVVIGMGYVGLSNAVLLAQHNEVVCVDISKQRVDALNARISPIIDSEISEYLNRNKLNLTASMDLKNAVQGADYDIIATPTNYDEKTNFFDICKITDDLSLLSSLFFDLHTKHSHPITGIPCDVPVPRNLIFNFFN